MQIRARVRRDLDGLQSTLGVPGDIIETRGADYRWRIIVEPETFQTIVLELAKRVDYSNFKDAVHDTTGQESKSVPYLRVWSAMRGLQDGTAGGVPAVQGGLFDFEPEAAEDFTNAGGTWLPALDLVQAMGAELIGRVVETEDVHAGYSGGKLVITDVGDGDPVAFRGYHEEWKNMHVMANDRVRLLPEGTPGPKVPKPNTKDALKNPKATAKAKKKGGAK